MPGCSQIGVSSHPTEPDSNLILAHATIWPAVASRASSQGASARPNTRPNGGEIGRISLVPVAPGPVSLPAHDVLQPSYCSTFKPEFQSETYTSPSVVTKISAAFAASATLGRGSISFLGVGGTQ